MRNGMDGSASDSTHSESKVILGRRLGIMKLCKRIFNRIPFQPVSVQIEKRKICFRKWENTGKMARKSLQSL